MDYYLVGVDSGRAAYVDSSINAIMLSLPSEDNKNIRVVPYWRLLRLCEKKIDLENSRLLLVSPTGVFAINLNVSGVLYISNDDINLDIPDNVLKVILDKLFDMSEYIVRFVEHAIN
jgi:hypothetical protein